MSLALIPNPSLTCPRTVRLVSLGVDGECLGCTDCLTTDEHRLTRMIFTPGSARGPAQLAQGQVGNSVEEPPRVISPLTSPEVLAHGHENEDRRVGAPGLQGDEFAGMVGGEIPPQGLIIRPHETPACVRQGEGAAVLGSVAPSLNAFQVRERDRRLQLVEGWAAIREREHAAGRRISNKRIADLLGVNHVTLRRYVLMVLENGRLCPQSEWSGRLTPGVSTGRPRKFTITSEMELFLKQVNLRTESKTHAVRMLAELPECPEELRDYLRTQRKFPPSLLRAAHVVPEQFAKHRGPKDFALNGYVNLRENFEVLADGTRRELRPGDWWVFDDASSNHPFYYEDPTSECGFSLGRQGLYCMDLVSRKWLGKMLIGRKHDAYRAEDILRFLRKLMQFWGKPRRGLRFERGIWRATAIKGWVLGDGQVSETESIEAVRPGMPEEDMLRLQDGLKGIGIEIQYVYKANTKGELEGAFSELWKRMRLLPATDIGRFTGEFERGAKAMVAVQAGRALPASKGFAYMDVMGAMIDHCLGEMDRSMKSGRLAQGVPNDLWLRSVNADALQPLEGNELAVFLPVRRERMIDGGHVLPLVNGKTYQFIHPEWFAELGHGYKVFVKFDPSEPGLGAAIYNRESEFCSANRGVPGGTRPFKDGEFICWAQYEPFAPQFSAVKNFNEETKQLRKRWQNYHRTTFSAIETYGGARSMESAARDGMGKVAVVSNQGPVISEQIKQLNAVAVPPPTAPKKQIGPTAEELKKQNEWVKRQAELARRLKAMREG